MAGFSDRDAPSIEAEYARYLEGDILGKIIFRNFCINIFGLNEDSLNIPMGKFGDYLSEKNPNADALVKIGDRYLDVEIKIARVNIANRKSKYATEDWAFNHLLDTGFVKKGKRKYDILFAAGIKTLKAGDPGYWKYLQRATSSGMEQGIQISADTLPHEPSYTSICGIYLYHFSEVQENFFRINLKSIEKEKKNSRFEKFSWGWDKNRCSGLWQKTVQLALNDGVSLKSE